MVGFLDRIKKFNKFFNSPINQLKIQVSSCKLQVASLQKEKTGSINRTPTIHSPLAFTFSLDRVEKIVKDGFPLARE